MITAPQKECSTLQRLERELSSMAKTTGNQGKLKELIIVYQT